MQMNITFRHIDPIDSLKNYAREKVERVNKYLDQATEATVVLSLERHLHHADIRIQSGTYLLRGREKSEDMYASIDLAMDKIEFLVRPMSVDEALMQMDLMNNDFYVFTNSTTMELNVVYHRKDGTVGLIEASAVQKKSLVAE